MMDLLEHLDEITDPLAALRPFTRTGGRYPETTPGTACVACGYEFNHEWDASGNHWLVRASGTPFPVCIGMNLRMNQALYSLRELGFPDPALDGDKCWCCGDPAHVCGTAKRGHANTTEHKADKVAHHWWPRVFEAWPPHRHGYVRERLVVAARYYGVLDLVRGDA